MPTVADAAAEALAHQGVEYIFGLPGGETLDLMEACRARSVEFILVNHEASGPFMAEVYHRLTGKPGACLATLGPGATNLVTGVAHATLDRIPLAAFTALPARATHPLATHQVLDLGLLLRGITKGTWDLTPENARWTLARGLRTALEPRPGAVHFGLASDVARAEVKGALVATPFGGPHHCDATLIARAADLLRASRKPLLAVGLGALRQGVPRLLRDFSQLLRIPVLATPKAKGVVDEEEANFLGVAGLGMAADRPLGEALGACDLLLAVGLDMVEFVDPWFDLLPREAPLVAVADHTSHDLPRVEVELVGDVGDTLSRLLAQFHGGGGLKWSEAEILEMRARVEASLRADAGRGVHPDEALRTLRRLLPPEAIATVDVGSHKILACQLWSCRHPGTFFVSNGLSSMGFALPAANAAKLVARDRPVVCITGDGGLLMALHEMEVTRRLGLPILAVVMDDGCLALIKEKQHLRGLPPYGMDFGSVDWPRMAEAFGWHGYRVESASSLEPTLKEAVGSREACLVDVAVDWEAYRPIL